MTPRKLAVLVLITASLGGAAAGSAEEIPPIPSPLSLEWCLESALERSPELAAEAAASSAARHRVVPAGSLDDPRFSYQLVNVPRDDLDLGATPMSGQQLGLAQRLPFPGLLASREGAARAAADSAQSALEDRRQRIASAVERAWAELGFAQRALAITDRNTELLRQLTGVAETKYAVGFGLPQDVLRAQVQLTTLLQQRLRRVSAVRTAEAGLVMGDDFVSASVTIRLPVNRAKWRERVAERSALLRRARAEERAVRAALVDALRAGVAELERADAEVELVERGLLPQARDNLSMLRRVLVSTPTGAQIPLEQLARLEISKGPPGIKSENARPNAWVYVDLEGVDVGTYVAGARERLARELELPAGYSLGWSGQYEYMERAARRLRVVLPVTIAIVFLLLYLNFRRASDALIVVLTLPFALLGGIWLTWLLDYDLSVAVGVGFIALVGVAAEIGVVLLVFLREAVARHQREGAFRTRAELERAVHEGAALRVRPVVMTVTAIVAGLLPIMWGSGTGSDTMKRIAAPMVGGMASATVLTLVVIPVIFALVRGFRLEPARPARPSTPAPPGASPPRPPAAA